MSKLKQLLFVFSFLGILIYGCKEEESISKNPSDNQVEYKFSFSLDNSFSLTKPEEKIDEIALLLYDDKEQFVSSAYATIPEITLQLSDKQKVAKALVLANFSQKGDWGMLILKDGKLKPIDLKEDILAKVKSPATWEECKRLGFGTNINQNNKEDVEMEVKCSPLSLPIPMVGTTELSSEGVHHIQLTPLVSKVTLKNISKEYPNIKAVTFRNVVSFSPLLPSEKEPATAFTCTINDPQPKINKEEDSNVLEEISYYLPHGTEIQLSGTLKNASDEECETLPYSIEATGKKDPLTIEISEKQLAANVAKIEFEVEGGEQVLQISSNLSWTASLDKQLFQIDTESGKGNGTITITAQPNEDSNELNDVLTIIAKDGGDSMISIPVNQKKKESKLPFTVELKYNGTVLGNELQIPAKGARGSLEMKTSTGRIEEDGYLYLRAAEGNSWAKIGHVWSNFNPNEIYHGRLESLLIFEENIGPERQMIAEFYSKKSGIVYHRVLFTQPAASNYMNFSASSLSADRYGNVYDKPYSLNVQSNNIWEIRCEDSWVKTNYTPNKRSQTIEIIVEENKSGQARSTNLEFVNNGNVVKTFPINQSNIESSTFSLKYELNLIMTTTRNRFKGILPTNGDTYYANNVEIFNPGTSSNIDETIKIRSDSKYGFVVDAPASFNKIEVKNIKSHLLVYPNYNGKANSQYNANGITITSKKYAQYFFRQIRYTLPIPAGVKRNQKVIYTITINNIDDNAKHDPPIIDTPKIVEQ